MNRKLIFLITFLCLFLLSTNNYLLATDPVKNSTSNLVDITKYIPTLEIFYELFVDRNYIRPETNEEIFEKMQQRRLMEDSLIKIYFCSNRQKSSRIYPLPERGFIDSRSFRRGHEAYDIFVKEGSAVFSVTDGIVVAVGDGWMGDEKNHYGGGFSKKGGNAVVIFELYSRSYFYYSHLQNGIPVKTGEIISAGTVIGKAGHSGSASKPGHGGHLHFANKKESSDGSLKGIRFNLSALPLKK